MLRFFGGGLDHPMAEARAARRILDELPAQDAKALEELAGWHESVAAVEGFKPPHRLQLVGLIDEAAQPRLRKLAREYFGAERPSRFQEGQMWTRLHEYWRNAGQAYAKCIELDVGKAALPLL